MLSQNSYNSGTEEEWKGIRLGLYLLTKRMELYCDDDDGVVGFSLSR